MAHALAHRLVTAEPKSFSELLSGKVETTDVRSSLVCEPSQEIAVGKVGRSERGGKILRLRAFSHTRSTQDEDHKQGGSGGLPKPVRLLKAEDLLSCCGYS